MRTFLTVVLLGVLLCSGCGVVMTAQYKSELDHQVALIKATVDKATAGELSEAEKTDVIKRCYVILRLWQDATSPNRVPSNEEARQAYIAAIYKELDQ